MSLSEHLQEIILYKKVTDTTVLKGAFSREMQTEMHMQMETTFLGPRSVPLEKNCEPPPQKKVNLSSSAVKYNK